MAVIDSPAQISGLETVFGTVISVALSLAGIAVLVMFVIGGFGFLTAGGDKEAAQKAQKTLTYAIAGLVLTVSAWIILKLIGQFLGVEFTKFSLQLPSPAP